VTVTWLVAEFLICPLQAAFGQGEQPLRAVAPSPSVGDADDFHRELRCPLEMLVEVDDFVLDLGFMRGGVIGDVHRQHGQRKLDALVLAAPAWARSPRSGANRYEIKKEAPVIVAIEPAMEASNK
jgi:hypothetical protein